MKRGRTVPMIGGDEYDWLTKDGRRALGYRKWLRWLKRKYNKRARRLEKMSLRLADDNKET